MTSAELPHKPVDVPNWSENYVFSGFDPEAGIGFYHHMARMPYDPEIWRGAFGMVLPDGRAKPEMPTAEARCRRRSSR